MSRNLKKLRGQFQENIIGTEFKSVFKCLIASQELSDL